MMALHVADAQLQFTNNLLQSLSENATRPVLVSPLSIILALSMAYVGSKGETRQEFNKTFCGQDDTEQQLFDYLSNFNQKAKSENNGVELFFKGYLNSEFTLKSDYTSKLLSLYGANVESLDFGYKELCAEKINSDVELATHEKIKEIVTKDMFDEQAFMFLVNTLYFKAQWREPLHVRKEKASFYSKENEVKQIKFMDKYSQHHTSYAENNQFRMLQMPFSRKDDYGNDVASDFRFSIFLPKQKCKLNEALSNSNGQSLLDLLSEASWTRANVHIPMFKFDYSISLSETLKKLGLEKGFNRADADFTGINNQVEALWINEVLHKTTIDVGRKGVEASAATAVQMHYYISLIEYKEDPIEFLADHPFLYLIHTTKNDILFAGIYNGN